MTVLRRRMDRPCPLSQPTAHRKSNGRARACDLVAMERALRSPRTSGSRTGAPTSASTPTRSRTRARSAWRPFFLLYVLFRFPRLPCGALDGSATGQAGGAAGQQQPPHPVIQARALARSKPLLLTHTHPQVLGVGRGHAGRRRGGRVGGRALRRGDAALRRLGRRVARPPRARRPVERALQLHARDDRGEKSRDGNSDVLNSNAIATRVGATIEVERKNDGNRETAMETAM